MVNVPEIAPASGLAKTLASAENSKNEYYKLSIYDKTAL
jgi:hypothetical protein